MCRVKKSGLLRSAAARDHQQLVGQRPHLGQVSGDRPSAAPGPRPARRWPGTSTRRPRRRRSCCPRRPRTTPSGPAASRCPRRTPFASTPGGSQPRPPTVTAYALLDLLAAARRTPAPPPGPRPGQSRLTPCPVTRKNPTDCSAASTCRGHRRLGRRRALEPRAPGRWSERCPCRDPRPAAAGQTRGSTVPSALSAERSVAVLDAVVPGDVPAFATVVGRHHVGGPAIGDQSSSRTSTSRCMPASASRSRPRHSSRSA